MFLSFCFWAFEEIDDVVVCMYGDMTKHQTAYDGKIFQLKLFCGKEYPESPPSVKFQTRINMACVNPQTGVVTPLCVCVCVLNLNVYQLIIYNKELYDQVEPSLFPMLANWRREYTMEDILVKLKKEMMTSHNRKLAQPPEGNFFCI